MKTKSPRRRTNAKPCVDPHGSERAGLDPYTGGRVLGKRIRHVFDERQTMRGKLPLETAKEVSFRG